MNVVIPMAGRGSRFEEAGYTSPKPLISVNGEPMITKALSSLDIEGNYHFVIRKDGNSNNIREAVLSIKPNAKFIEIDYITEGPASSVLLFEKEINNLLNKYPLFNNEPVDAEFIEDDSPIGIEFPEWLSKSIKTGKVEAKTIQNECSPGICYDIWRDGDW